MGLIGHPISPDRPGTGSALITVPRQGRPIRSGISVTRSAGMNRYLFQTGTFRNTRAIPMPPDAPQHRTRSFDPGLTVTIEPVILPLYRFQVFQLIPSALVQRSQAPDNPAEFAVGV